MTAAMIVFLLIIPALMGIPIEAIGSFFHKDNRKQGMNFPQSYLLGALLMVVLSGGIQFVVRHTNQPFSLYAIAMAVICVFFSLIGLGIGIASFSKWKQEKPETGLLLLCLILFVAGCVRIFMLQPDVTGDFTLETIRTTLSTNTIYEYNSLTGRLIEEGMPIRQEILTLPFFGAFLCRMFGADAQLVVYKVLPCFVLLLSLFTAYFLAEHLFMNNRKSRQIFLLAYGMLLLLGDSSSPMPAYEILHRGFTGSAWVCGFLTSLVLYCCIQKKWLFLLLCLAAEIFLHWTTYGLGFGVLVVVGCLMVSAVRSVLARFFIKEKEGRT